MGGARRVLIVDDDADFRMALRELLEDEGRTVYEARDGRAALRLLKTVTPDLIFVDLMMPVMDGVALREALQRDAVLANVPLAVLSGADEIPAEGFAHVLRKPVDLPNLLGLLEAIDNPRATT
jgi:CheY-like chemotaxis protein